MTLVAYKKINVEFLLLPLDAYLRKQPSIGVLTKRCSENMPQIYRRMPMPNCDFNKIAFQLYRNQTSAWVFSFKFAAYFQNFFSRNTSGGVLLCLWYCKSYMTWLFMGKYIPIAKRSYIIVVWRCFKYVAGLSSRISWSVLAVVFILIRI